MTRPKKKEMPDLSDQKHVVGKELRLEQEKFAKMMVYVEQTEHKLAEAIAKAEKFRTELDFYKKAKEENERFMRERDEARADLAEYKEWATEELNKASAQAHAALDDMEMQWKDAKKEAFQFKADYEGACKIIADMHAAAVGEVRGPSIGPVEDVAALHQAAKKVALALKKDIIIVAPNLGSMVKELKNQNIVMSVHADVLDEIHKERVRQDAKWGQQNHPDGTCAEGQAKAKAHADSAKSICNHFAKIGKLTWAHIFSEEMMEAYAETDPEKLEKEIIQTCAVGVAWVECIRRRQSGQES